ncbi:MAG TPA: sulfotransferase family 2 domain-containing protein [Rhizomicrobium sp.]
MQDVATNTWCGDAGAGERSDTQRTLIFHYHLFKNAGTSVDELLRRNFGSRWVAQEFATARRENAAAIAEFITGNPQLQAMSSHTAHLPVPQLDGIEIFPIIFLRHPIDRLRSAYEFERRQNASTAGARLAKAHDLAGYLRELLKHPRNRQVRNFQTYRLSLNEPKSRGTELQRAQGALENLPFVGVVEDFDESVRRLAELLQPKFPDFKIWNAHRNTASGRDASLGRRLESVNQTLGDDLYDELCKANQDDIELYDQLKAAMPRLQNSHRA